MVVPPIVVFLVRPGSDRACALDGGPLADLLRQLDDHPLGAADVAESVAVLVLLQLADELGAASPQAGDDGVGVFDVESDVAEARLVRRRVPVAARRRRR